MELKTLQKLRFFVPGVLFFILILFFLPKNLNDLTNYLEFYNYFIEKRNILFYILIIFISLLYYIFDIRKFLLREHLEKIHENIKDKLLEPFRNNYSHDEINSLKQGRKLINIFYYFIDKDPSLKEKAKSVRFNGLIWTSSMDLQIISYFGSIIFFIKFMIVKLNYYFYMTILVFFLVLISPLFINLLTKKHMSLGNEQLEIIHESHEKELEKRINDLLS